MFQSRCRQGECVGDDVTGWRVEPQITEGTETTPSEAWSDTRPSNINEINAEFSNVL